MRHCRPTARQPLAFLGMIVLLGLSAGCGQLGGEASRDTKAPPPIQTLVEEQRAPKWITNKGAAFAGEKEVFFGVGNASGIRNTSLMRRTAEGMARRDIAQTLNTYVEGMQLQYIAETTSGSMDRHSVEQHVEDIMRQLTKATLVGTSIVEYWENPTRNEAYALARLDLAGFLETVSRYRAAADDFAEVDAGLRTFVRDNAAEMHDRLRWEEERQGDTASPPSSDPRAHLLSENRRPDPDIFETGDLLWTKQPFTFIPYASKLSSTYEADREDWLREKRQFIDRVRSDPKATDFGRRVAADLEGLSFDVFRSRYLGGTDEDTVSAAGWIPWVGHVSMIMMKDGEPWVVEAFLPKVRALPYDEWLSKQGDAQLWHGRLKGLDAAARTKPVEEALRQVGKPFVFFSFNLADTSGFYCSKLVWYSIYRSLGLAVDDDPEPQRRFWFSPKQLLNSRHVQLIQNAGPYAVKAQPATGDQSSRAGASESAPVPVLPPGATCASAFSQCVERCSGGDLEACTISCCCQHGGSQCPEAPDCCPN